MRIRTYRPDDFFVLRQLQQLAVETDRLAVESVENLLNWLQDAAHEPEANVFVIRDDDDELNPWGQAGTLDGIEGEIMGFTMLELFTDPQAYYFRCVGTVHPNLRGQNAGRSLLICALNRARLVATEFEFEAEQAGRTIYFEALLPTNDAASPHLAAKCEMSLVSEPVPQGVQLYRRVLW